MGFTVFYYNVVGKLLVSIGYVLIWILLHTITSTTSSLVPSKPRDSYCIDSLYVVFHGFSKFYHAEFLQNLLQFKGLLGYVGCRPMKKWKNLSRCDDYSHPRWCGTVVKNNLRREERKPGECEGGCKEEGEEEGGCGKQKRSRRGGARNAPAFVSLHPLPNCSIVLPILTRVLLSIYPSISSIFPVFCHGVTRFLHHYPYVTSVCLTYTQMHLPQSLQLHRINGFARFFHGFISVLLLHSGHTSKLQFFRCFSIVSRVLYAIMVPHRSLTFTWHHFTLSPFFPPFFLAF